MNYEDFCREIERLNFEDLLWGTFAVLSLLNIYGDYDDKEYLKSHNNRYRLESNKVFTFTLIVTFFIYLYFFLRNYKSYENISQEQKKLYMIKVLGSVFLIAGVVSLLYFQRKQSSFIGSLAL